MSAHFTPSHEVTVELVEQLLREQAPHLADLPLSPAGTGWDNGIYRLGETMAVRLPSRDVADELLTNEQRWLPILARAVSVQVPEPIFIGAASATFAHPWSVVPWFPGTAASDLDVAQRNSCMEGLLDFFIDLHVQALPGAPENPYRGLAINRREFDESFRRAVAGRQDAAALLERWLAWRGVPDWDAGDVWVHGDAHPGNLILDASGDLAAVIDWGDVTAGDPASDLATIWMTFDAPTRETFIERYSAATGVSDATWTRAKAWALRLAALFASSDARLPNLAHIGEETLERLLAEKP